MLTATLYIHVYDCMNSVPYELDTIVSCHRVHYLCSVAMPYRLYELAKDYASLERHYRKKKDDKTGNVVQNKL